MPRRQSQLERPRPAQNAQDETSRDAGLVAEYVTQQQFDQAKAEAAAAQATVRADEAAFENARLQLEYCSVRTPIDGRTGSLLVQVGNIVKANDDRTLLQINQIRPILVTFSVPEANFSEITRRVREGRLSVNATPQDGGPPAPGELRSVDNAVNASTGTIKQLTFPNRDSRLWPGQFVPSRTSVIGLTPSSSFAGGPDGPAGLAFVGRSDGRVAQRDGRPGPGAAGRHRQGPGRGRTCRHGRSAAALTRREGGDQGRPGGALMNVAELFIRRPVTTTLVMVGILLFGVMGYRQLPISDLPNVDFPTIQVIAKSPRASPETIGAVVARRSAAVRRTLPASTR
jgi:multidrug efflux system membrane fusion protein